jgi:hypothetical protein
MRIPTFDRLVAGSVVLALLAAACSDEPEPTREVFADVAEENNTTSTLIPSTPTDPPETLRPTLGEMEVPCGLTDDPAPPLDGVIGVGEMSILIGTGNDRGGLHTFGSGRGIPDAVEVMAGYCNSLGGLAGRNVLVLEYDAAAVEAADRAAEQCAEVASVVGHGYLDEAGADDVRDLCRLPSFPAWVGGLVAGEPFSLHGHLLAFFLEPAAGNVALVGPATPTGAEQRAIRRSALESSDSGFVVATEIGYPIAADPGWDSVAAAALDSGAGLVHIDGSCRAAVVPFLRGAAALDWSPVLLGGPSAYDPECVAEAAQEGLGIHSLIVELPFLPLEDGAVDAPVTAAYAEMFAELAAPVTGDALLAASAFWRWALAVGGCTESMSRSCLQGAAALTVGWTAGGLHRPYDFDGSTDPCLVVMGVVDGAFVRQLPESPGTYDCEPERSVVLRSAGR